MTERARVLEIHDGQAVLQCYESAGCESCNSMFCNVKARTFKAAVQPGLPVKYGDLVDVFVPPARAIGSGFMVLMFPLLMFLGAYLAFAFLESEAAQVGTGIAGMALGFLLVFLFGRRRRNDLPTVVKIHPASEIPARAQTDS